MHTASLLVTALVAAASLASAEQAAKPAARPRIYFPRHIKRQFFNATTTFTEPSSTQSSETQPNTSKKDLSDLFPIFGSSSSSTSSSSGDSDPNVTTIVKHSTIYVTPSAATETPSSDSSSDSTSSGSTESSDSTSADPTTTGGSASSSGIPDIVLLPTKSSSSSSSESSSSASSSASSSGSSSESSSVSSNTSSIASSTASSSVSSDASNSTVTTGSASSDVPTSTVVSTTSGILIAPTGVVTPTSSSAGLLDPVGSLLSGVLSDVSTILVPGSTNGTDQATATAPISETFTLPGTGVTPTPTSSGIFISLTLSSGGTAPPPSSTLEPPPPVSVNTTTPGEPTQTIGPTNNGTATDPPTLTSQPTVTPNNTLTEEPVPSTSTSSLPTTIPIPANTTDIVPQPTTAPPTTTSASTASGLTSLPAISTITNSDPWLPPTIIVQPSTSTLSGGGLAPTATGGIPSNIPKAITPNSGTEPIPDGTVEIQIGFRYPLNFKFLAENPKAAAQVLWGVPEMLSHAGDFDKSKAQMRRLIPLDTSGNYGFVTTLAIATYPENQVAQLRIDIHAPNSQVYNNPNALVYNISQLINPAIDIIVGSGVGDSTTGSGDGSSSTSTSNPNGDVFNDNGSDQSSSKRGETVGIAMGAIVVSVAYGTAMFIVARRYKRKKQGHRRASSISSPATSMRQTPSPVMGGALLSRDFSSYGGVAGGRDSHGSGRSNMNNSGRTAYISAPVAAENSLGWN